MNFYAKIIKRSIDIIASVTALVMLSPVFIISGIILFFQNRGKVFFFQNRPGLNKKSFRIIKFKSMTDERDAAGNLLPDIKRITVFGTFIRKSSIDELPQLINVFLGDMSLVGPRPLLFKYIPLYNERQNKRHLVKPGITGWAQVNGRNSISWSEKFELDVYYVENISFQIDIQILWLTFKKVIIAEGVNQSVGRPMLPFDGTN